MWNTAKFCQEGFVRWCDAPNENVNRNSIS
ncbi:hypothetical protein Pla175_04880 [Pirellulimonas nuda]|uniref:Uncharacterized protein n=1 Tax=Pirellulimonas nuda TaxID=2528009 RepID=A0A518D6L9_9BACT|nr:hypothetical protein Pla175_04880 [Pirellulimonas nuda]